MRLRNLRNLNLVILRNTFLVFRNLTQCNDLLSELFVLLTASAVLHLWKLLNFFAWLVLRMTLTYVFELLWTGSSTTLRFWTHRISLKIKLIFVLLIKVILLDDYRLLILNIKFIWFRTSDLKFCRDWLNSVNFGLETVSLLFRIYCWIVLGKPSCRLIIKLQRFNISPLPQSCLFNFITRHFFCFIHF